MDSLQTEGVDTIIGYYDGCSGCIRGTTKTYYIYWYSEEWYLTKFNNYSNFNVISRERAPIGFISENLDSLEHGKLRRPAFELLHYHYDRIQIILPNRTFEFQVNEYQNEANPMSEKVVLIDKIRSGLLDVRGWKGLSYRFEKVRMDYR